MSESVNYETNDRQNAVEVEISVPLNADIFRFKQPVPRYIHGKLKAEDWESIGRDLRTHAESVVRRLALSGAYFAPNGVELAREMVMEGARDLIHRAFRTRNNEAGNLEWAVPSLLKGDFYA